MLKDSHLVFDEQQINDLYTEYRETPMGYTCVEWISFWFAVWTIEKNGTELHDKFKS